MQMHTKIVIYNNNKSSIYSYGTHNLSLSCFQHIISQLSYKSIGNWIIDVNQNLDKQDQPLVEHHITKWENYAMYIE